MLRLLATFPLRAAARAAWAVLSTEPLPTIVWGPEEDFDYVSTTAPKSPPPTVRACLDGHEVARTVGRHREACQ